MTGNWTKEITGDEHNHDGNQPNEPNDNTGLSEAENNILEAIIQELRDPKTKALKKIRSLWHLKYASFRLNGGAVVVPFPDQKKVQYRLNNRLRGLINDDTIASLEAIVSEYDIDENSFAFTRVNLLLAHHKNEGRLVHYYRHHEKIDGRECWILIYTSKEIVKHLEDHVRVIASEGAMVSVTNNSIWQLLHS